MGDGREVSDEDAHAMGEALEKVLGDIPDVPVVSGRGKTPFAMWAGYAKPDLQHFISYLKQCGFTIRRRV